jgi:hypothetical protein
MKDAFNKAKTATQNFVGNNRAKIGVLIGVAIGAGALVGAKAIKDRKGQAAA